VKRISAVLLSTLVVVAVLCSIAPSPVLAAAPVIDNVQPVGVTETGAVITWTTDINATGNVEYGTTSGSYPNSAPTPADASADSTLHAVVLSGLSAGTTYYYRVKSSNLVDPESVSAEYSFQTESFTISGIAVPVVGVTSATVTWNTSTLATSNVEYGTTAAYGSSAPVPADTTADAMAHVVALTGLSDGTTYHCRIRSEDGSGIEVESDDFTFTTLTDTSPPDISGVAPSGITIATSTTAMITWDTDEPASSQAEYGTTSTTHGSYDSTSYLIDAGLTSHAISLGGLSPDTTYYYRVISKDTYDNEAVSTEYSFTTATDTTQPVIKNVAASVLTTTTVAITWETDELATSNVEYGTTVGYGSTAPTPADTVADRKAHVVVLSGLSPGTPYHYRVKSQDVYGNEAVSIDDTFATTADTTAPVISGITETGVNADTATIQWNTDEFASTQVEYGTTAGYGSTTVLDATLVLEHTVSLDGLQSGTTYHYRVKSVDASGNIAISDDNSFTTLDVEPPGAPTNVAVTTPSNDNTPTFTWTAATDDASGVASYQARIDSASFADIGNVTTFTVTGANAVADGSHTFEVRAVDNAGNVGAAGSVNFNIDATPPTAPTNLTRTTPDRVNTPTFTWDDSTDAASGLERYQVSMDSGEFADIGAETTYTVANALADGSHTIQVRAKDRAGNVGDAASLDFSIDAIDATPPTTPTNITITTPEGKGRPTFTWEAATDAASGIAYYEVRIVRVDAEDGQDGLNNGTGILSGQFINIGNTTTYTVAEEDALDGGNYTFEVRAVDGAGNIGEAGTLEFDVAGPSSKIGMILGIVFGVLIAAALLVVYLMRVRGGAAKPSSRSRLR